MEEKEPRVAHIPIYYSYFKTAEELTVEEFYEYWMAILRFGFYDEKPTFSSRALSISWHQTQATLKTGINAILNGSKGGRKKKEPVTDEEENGFKGGFKPGFLGGFKQMEKEMEKEKEKKKEKEKEPRRQLHAICPECGGLVAKSNNSPNWVCLKCKQPYSPAQISEMEVANNG